MQLTRISRKQKHELSKKLKKQGLSNKMFNTRREGLGLVVGERVGLGVN